MENYVVDSFPLEKEYKKPTGINPQDIARLRQWLATQPHLPREHITDLDLILVYHSCNRSSEMSKQIIDLHYTLRTLFSKLFKDRYFDNRIEQILNLMLLKPLPTRSKDGYAVMYTSFLDSEPKNFFFAETLRSVLMILDLWQREEGTWPGFMLVFDLAGIKLGHLSKIDLQIVQQFLFYLQEAMLVKFKGIHFLNAPTFMDKLMMMIRPFMKKELLEMIRIHQIGSNTLDAYIPIQGLPKEAGGKYKSYEECREEVLLKMRANKHYFEEENKKRLTESLRPGKPKTITDIFGGIEGSFKKLEID